MYLVMGWKEWKDTRKELKDTKQDGIGMGGKEVMEGLMGRRNGRKATPMCAWSMPCVTILGDNIMW